MTLDIAAIANVIARTLPMSARWIVGSSPLDFDFRLGHSGLAELEEMDADFDGAKPQEFLVFGESDYCAGGGAHPWICIRKIDGWVCGFDLERQNEVFSYNSSIERFSNSFLLIQHYLRQGSPQKLDGGVIRMVHETDPRAFERSEWKALLDLIMADSVG